jgi:pimeloyl-ACP methyl ester carboxylesterase
MDGTGEMFSEFIAALPRGIASIVVKYPVDRALNYAELEELVRASLPVERPFILLGESFSGPIAVSLAATKPAGLRGLVLVCSFVRSPLPVPNALTSVISRFPVGLVPISIAAAVLLGRYGSQTLRARLAAAIAKVCPAVWRARLQAVLSTDVSAHLRNISVPIIYLRAANDRVVSRRASDLIATLLPRVKFEELEAPHFMLQAKPLESAACVEAFAREVGFAF